jgi:hypothetical protein
MKKFVIVYGDLFLLNVDESRVNTRYIDYQWSTKKAMFFDADEAKEVVDKLNASSYGPTGIEIKPVMVG